MAFPKDTMRLGAAKATFTGVDFEEVSIGDKVVGYKATLDGLVYEHTSLTALCKNLWSTQREGEKYLKTLCKNLWSARKK